MVRAVTHRDGRKQVKRSKKHVAEAKTRRAKTAKKAVRPAVIDARAEGLRLFTVAGRASKADVIKVYGPKGPWMTWGAASRSGRASGEVSGRVGGEAVGSVFTPPFPQPWLGRRHVAF